MNTQNRLIMYGAESLSTQELLSLIISGSKTRTSLQIAEDLFTYSFNELSELSRASVDELTQIEGIGIGKACAIAASLELAKRLNEVTCHRVNVRSSKDVASLLIPALRHQTKEHVVVLLLNSKGDVISKEIVSIGGLSSSNADPREIFNPAVRRSAATIILVHNHPSGDCTPSADDDTVTSRIKDAGAILGIPLIDHIIIGGGNFYSYAAENKI